MSPSNGDLSELLWRAGDEETAHRRRALHRASRAARFWTEEARDVAEAGRSLTELRGVGPWVAARIHWWLDAPPGILEPDETRRGFLTLAEVRRVLDAEPLWEDTPHADLQVHSTASDGAMPVREVALLAKDLGRTFIASTDHSQSLKIAHGMDEVRLAEHVREIDRLNEELGTAGESFRVLRSIEMDIFVDGSVDMPPEALAPLDVVLGAFHSKLRIREDQTGALSGRPARSVGARPRPSAGEDVWTANRAPGRLGPGLRGGGRPRQGGGARRHPGPSRT